MPPPCRAAAGPDLGTFTAVRRQDLPGVSDHAKDLHPPSAHSLARLSGGQGTASMAAGFGPEAYGGAKLAPGQRLAI